MAKIQITTTTVAVAVAVTVTVTVTVTKHQHQRQPITPIANTHDAKSKDQNNSLDKQPPVSIVFSMETPNLPKWSYPQSNLLSILSLPISNISPLSSSQPFSICFRMQKASSVVHPAKSPSWAHGRTPRSPDSRGKYTPTSTESTQSTQSTESTESTQGT